MTSDWRRRRKDHFSKMAKKENYRSRASFKLLEAIRKYGFIRDGDVVVDLGAYPGGWLQVAREIVGDNGFVLGVDLRKIEHLGFDNVQTIIGDILDRETVNRIKAILPRQADAVISDVSPNVSGVWEVDHARQIELAERSLSIAISILRVGGSFFVKVFRGELFEEYLKHVKNFFLDVRVFKPKASRTESAEIYVLGLNYQA
ncbi:MAG: RlmE family RNA methyltransferase [Nitrososphaerota archaeon]|nr:RlmE family RNA methyltransferase [Candidatus Bathyarchaeota archaeon]MDW8048798.1 RlmE family RNA methyltransferase [Nitrososphaerota archaeon]